MTEHFLQFIWKNRLFDTEELYSSTGERIEVVDVGEQNTHAGPDFLNVKVRIGATLWAGSTEVHLRSSDWQKHKHTGDNAYNNVILHVVEENDKPIKRHNGEEIPTIKLTYNRKYLDSYLELYRNEKWVPCQENIGNISPFILRQWLGRLLVERLEKKSEYILTVLQFNGNSWEETFYQLLARNFGLHVNAQPFEMLAKSLPLKVLAKHKDNLPQIEALLFGQAGFLGDTIPGDTYFEKMKKEYQFLQHKFQLTPLDKHLWKFLRLRPVNFPTIRIAQFAVLIHQSSALFTRLLECKQPEEYKKLLSVSVSDYWTDHYHFGKSSARKEKTIGASTIDIFIINTIVPFLFIYGKRRNIDRYLDKSLQLLESLCPENNVLIRNWEKTGIKAENAFYSQALIQLKNEYCKFRRCLDCEVGNKIILEGCE